MNVSVKFLGAAKSVTGSKYLLKFDSTKILVDCGLFQGLKELRLRNWDTFPGDPSAIQQIVITHAHIDHLGYLPRMVRSGFSGRIICTHATHDLMEIMLRDAAKLQEEEAQFASNRGYSKHLHPEPLFDLEDAENVLSLVKSYPMEEAIEVIPNVTVTYHNAGHILGAAWIEMNLKGTRESKRIVFSGDLGRYNDPIMYDPKDCYQADVLFIESTYGDRLNPMDKVQEELVRITLEAIRNNGVILVPAFAVGRTQSLIWYFHQLMKEKLIPNLPIYIDSPMAISATDIYERNSSYHKIEVKKKDGDLISIFDSPNIHFCNTVESSKALNNINTPCLIISASGMCTGGRILHHLYHRLRKPCDTILFAGYQAEGTRGKSILQGNPSITIFGEEVPVNCHVREVNGLSAHADQSELLHWVSRFGKKPKRLFIIHGEEKAAMKFADLIREKMGWESEVPDYLESTELFSSI